MATSTLWDGTDFISLWWLLDTYLHFEAEAIAKEYCVGLLKLIETTSLLSLVGPLKPA